MLSVGSARFSIEYQEAGEVGIGHGDGDGHGDKMRRVTVNAKGDNEGGREFRIRNS
jgi:hypothetical protein